MDPVTVDRNGRGQSVAGHTLGSVFQAKVRAPPTCHSWWGYVAKDAPSEVMILNVLQEGICYKWERYISQHLPQLRQTVIDTLTTGEMNNQSVLTAKRKARGGVKQTEEQSLGCKYFSDNTPNFLKLYPVGSVILGIWHGDAGVRITKSAGSWPCKQEQEWTWRSKHNATADDSSL